MVTVTTTVTSTKQEKWETNRGQFLLTLKSKCIYKTCSPSFVSLPFKYKSVNYLFSLSIFLFLR